MPLSATTSAKEIAAALAPVLIQKPLDQAVASLTDLGARDVVLTDIGAVDLPPRTVMGDGIAAGDPVALVLFGLRRGFLRADKRVRLTLHYDADRTVTQLTDVTLIAK